MLQQVMSIVIDSKQLLRPVEMMRNLRGTATGGLLDQIKVEVNEDCNWKSKRPPRDNSPLGDIILNTQWGLASIHKAKVQRRSPDGGSEGVAVGVTLFIEANKNAEAQVYRCIIGVATDDWAKVLLPLQIEDRSTKREGSGILLNIEDTELRLYFFGAGPRNGYVVIEVKSAQPELKTKFENQSKMIRYLISYLTGFGLDGNSTIVALDKEGSPIEIEQHLGRRIIRNPYRPIPISGVDILQCDLAADHEVIPPLSSEVLKKCLLRLLDEPNLITPLEYLRRFNEVPSEMRGVLLSVALESATSHFEQRGLLKSKKPLEDKVWQTLRATLLATIAEAAKREAWDKDTQNIFIQRISNMNGPTNADQLRQPFDVLKLTLREDEIAAIKHRNNFIHRGRLLKVEDHEKDPSKWTTVWGTEMILYTAINKLFLKYLGYSGPVIDWGRKTFGTPKIVFDFLKQSDSAE